MIVEVGAKTTPTSTIFIYMFGSKALGSSLESQIAAKNVANCDSRLKNKIICFYDTFFSFLVYRIRKNLIVLGLLLICILSISDY